MADWRRLSDMCDEYVTALYGKAVKEGQRFPNRSVVHIAAETINAGHAAPYQMAIVFAAGTQINLQGTLKLIEELQNLPAGAIHTRISRIYAVLHPPGTEESS